MPRYSPLERVRNFAANIGVHCRHCPCVYVCADQIARRREAEGW